MRVNWWLGPLNFLLLQWFGVRLAAVLERRDGPVIGWMLLRWVFPLTGWWSDFRWIGRHRSIAKP